MKWVVETTVFEQEAPALVEEIKKQGHELHLADGKEIVWGGKPLPSPFDEKTPIVVRGSIEFCNHVKRNCDWFPGVYMDMTRYNCTEYYPIFGDKLLNDEYVMLPFGELGRRKEWLYKTLGEADTLFIRPNRGNKIFSGQLVFKENWDKDLDRLGFYDTPQDELCVVARPKKLGVECRLIVVRDRIICGTTYKDHDNELMKKPLPIYNEAFIGWANNWFKTTGYIPDTVWSLDITYDKSDGQYKVLEVGAFSCCGLYGCPPSIIVEEVSKVAQEEWDDLYG